MVSVGGDAVTDIREQQKIIENLKDAGCDDLVIEQFLMLEKEQKKQEQLRLLSSHRKTLLNSVHKNQKRIDCLDYLLYKLKP